MAAQNEIPMDDAELDALMEQLERETSGAVDLPPVIAPAVVTEPAVDITEEELNEIVTEEAAAAPVLNTDAELKELQAEMAQEGSMTIAIVSPPSVSLSICGEKLEQLSVTETTAVFKYPEIVPEPKEAEPAPNPMPKPQPKLQFYLDVDAFKKDIAVSDNNLDTAMMQQAGLFAFHAAESARAEAQHNRVKLRFDVVEAKLYDRHRKALALTVDKVTEKMVENAVKMDPEFLAAKNLVIEADMLSSFNKGAVESLRHRKDMIVQLGADRREEYKGQTRIMAIEQGEEAARSRALAAVASLPKTGS